MGPADTRRVRRYLNPAARVGGVESGSKELSRLWRRPLNFRMKATGSSNHASAASPVTIALAWAAPAFLIWPVCMSERRALRPGR
jgi:hypothetical protein